MRRSMYRVVLMFGDEELKAFEAETEEEASEQARAFAQRLINREKILWTKTKEADELLKAQPESPQTMQGYKIKFPMQSPFVKIDYL